jgi:hypothetical protein
MKMEETMTFDLYHVALFVSNAFWVFLAFRYIGKFKRLKQDYAELLDYITDPTHEDYQ